jgi:FkbM family methyltransferase
MSEGDELAFLIWRAGFRRESEEWQRETGWRPENLRKPGLAPATVIDVGVARGTPNLYRAFPDAHLVLIEPLAEFEEDLRRIATRRGGEYVLAAVGAEPGSATIHVDPHTLYGSSLLVNSWAAPGAPAPEKREIEVTTLDRLRDERAWPGPFGLKIDVEGYELQVIGGAVALLRETQFVIAEVSVAQQYAGSAPFAEFVAAMSAHGFGLNDVLDGRRRGAGGVDFLDLMFLRN